MSTIPTAEKITRLVRHLRDTAPQTRMDICDRLGWSPSRAGEVIREARYQGLVTRSGKTDRGQFVFAAVQTADWPAHHA